MKIDEGAGLPELPEGQFWRIGENEISIMGAPRWTDWTTTSNAYRNALEVETRIRDRDSSKWWEIRRPGQSRKLPEFRFLITSRLHIQGFGEWDYSESGWGRYLKTPDPVTRENVVQRCQALLQRVAEEERKKAEDEAFYGDYPPKKLESM